MRTTRRIALLIVLATIGLVGCGDDDDSDASTDTTEEGTTDGDLATYCDKTYEIETLGEPDVDFETASEEEQTTAIKAFATEKLQPLAADIQAAAPAEIEDDIDLLVGAVDTLAATGDFESTFGSPEIDAASTRAHAFDLKSCGWNQVDVTAKDYAFEGIASELDAGKTSFEFTNAGTELHEMIVIRKNDDTTESFDELLALPEEQAQQKTTVAGAAFGAPGDEEYAVVDLEAGEYIALCFIPEGTTDENTEGQGPPHFTKGMKQEFTVS
jgi:hypothetical protein